MPKIALGRELSVCVVPETTVGTIAVPTSAHSVLVSDGGTFNQAGNFIDDIQKRPSRARFGRIRGKYAPGDWAFSTYIKPQAPLANVAYNEHLYDGLLGTRTFANVPNGLLIIGTTTGQFTATEAVTGSIAGAGTVGAHNGGALTLSAVATAFVAGEVITGGTSGSTAVVVDVKSTGVAFTPAYKPASYSIWAKKGHSVQVQVGATVNQGVFTVNGVDAGSCAWTGQFIKQIWTGTSVLTANVAAAATTATVTDGNLYNVDSRVVITNSITGAVVDDNAGLGYLVSAVNATTNVLTISTAGGFVIGGALATDSISPWFPAVVDAGTIVHGRIGSVSMAGSTIAVTDASVTIANNIQYIIDEKDGADYPSSYEVPGTRDVSSSVGLYFREADLSYFNQGVNANSVPTIIPLGTLANQRATIYLPNSVLDIPSLDAGTMVKLTTTLRGEAHTPEVSDDIVIVFD